MKDAYYFPHFSNARQDRKIRRLRKQLGIEGYGIYFMILEVLRDQQNFNYPVEDIDLLSDEFDTSDEKVKAVIFNYNLFEIDETKCFFSTKFNLFLEPYLKGKERRKIGGIKGNLIKYNHLTKDQVSKMTDDEIVSFNNSLANRSLTDSHTDRNASQRKVKESKGKEKKVKESKGKDISKVLLSEIKISDVPTDEIDFYKIALSFYDLFVKIKEDKGVKVTTLKKAKYKSWVNPIRLMIFTDKIPTTDIRRIYWFLDKGKTKEAEFWRLNIQSTSKIREHYERLKILADNAKNGNNYNNNQKEDIVDEANRLKREIFERNIGNKQRQLK